MTHLETHAPRKFALLCCLGAALTVGCSTKNGVRDVHDDRAEMLNADSVQVGYGKQSRMSVTGAVGSLVPAREETSRFSRVEDLLAGRIAGVDVVRHAGGQYSLRIRGGAGGCELVYLIFDQIEWAYLDVGVHHRGRFRTIQPMPRVRPPNTIVPHALTPRVVL